MIRSTWLWLGCTIFLLSSGGCANRPPTLNCIAEPTTITEGESTTIQTNASDSESRPLSFDWQADEGKLTQQNGSAIFDSTGLSPGTYSVGVDVRDQKNQVSCSVEVTVEKRKLAPTVTCEPSNLEVTEGQSITLEAKASDPNDDPLNYSWSVDGEEVTADEPSFDFGTVGRSVGSHRTAVTVTDVDGLAASCTFNVNITARPNPPLSLSLGLDKTEVYAGETITATATAKDPDNDPLTFAWKVNGQGRSETTSTLKIDTSGLAAGNHSVSVTVEDDRGDSQAETKSFKVREKVVIQVDRARPDNVGKARLDEIAVKMQQNVQLKALITGHTDDRGSEENNLKVGQKRADGTKDYLVKEHPIDESRIETESAGETKPISDNSTAEGRKENRRVELELFVP